MSPHLKGNNSFAAVKLFLTINGYELGGVIGEGSYGKVRIAEKNGKKLAIKIINKGRTSTSYLRDFLPSELQILSKVNNRNIINIHRLIDFDNHVCIFMEFADKGDLLTKIEDEGFLEETCARKYFRDLIQAVDYLHRNNICHRDLKCENLLITNNNVLKVGDFGFSKEVTNLDMSESYCGTVAYMSPEQSIQPKTE